MITAHGSVQGAVDAMREGATDYLLKLEAEVPSTWSRAWSPCTADAGDVIAADPRQPKSMGGTEGRIERRQHLNFRRVGSERRCWPSTCTATRTALISPCGSELCAIPENMLESCCSVTRRVPILAAYQARGKFEQANGGTILLDEISEMPWYRRPNVTCSRRELERLGSYKVINLDVRVIATTNRNLMEEVAEGRFREDLYYRLNVFPLHLAPLRERRADIMPLAELFLSKYQPADRPLRLDIPAAEKIRRATWQGNVRELENCIQRATILCQPDGLVREADIVITEPLCGAEPIESEASADQPRLDGDLKQREHELICEALEASGGKKKEAAERLGISPRTLRYKLARLRQLGVALPA